MSWYIAAAVWATGWAIHAIILLYSWWSGRLWWNADPDCGRAAPKMLSLGDVFGFTVVGIPFWFFFVFPELFDWLEFRRNKHIEAVKFRNRPLEEVLGN